MSTDDLIRQLESGWVTLGRIAFRHNTYRELVQSRIESLARHRVIFMRRQKNGLRTREYRIFPQAVNVEVKG